MGTGSQDLPDVQETEALPHRLEGMNTDLIEQYIKHVADVLVTKLGVPKMYHASNPVSQFTIECLQATIT